MTHKLTVDGIEIDYSGLPENHRDTVRLYIEHGYHPGSGWQAILQNNLLAVVMVDDETFEELPWIYRWLVNHAPSQCWGSAEKACASQCAPPWRRPQRPSRWPPGSPSLFPPADPRLPESPWRAWRERASKSHRSCP